MSEERQRAFALAQTLLSTFTDPEINYVTFERVGEEWTMRRFTRAPDTPPHV